MYLLIAIVFVLGYAAIVMEHPLKVNKAAAALLTGMLVWTLIMVGHGDLFAEGTHDHAQLSDELFHHLSGIASILFFLLGAMTVVELMDAHAGFQIITDRITAKNKVALLWVIGIISFFLSAALDNMTTAIVMCALLRKMIADRTDLWTFAGLVIIAANAGGAWSPVGDVTTIMLWIDGQVTTWNIIVKLFVPSLVCLVLPLLWISRTVKGSIERPAVIARGSARISKNQRIAVFLIGLFTLLGVPLFKHFTHLPPFMGVMLGLGVLWVYTEFIHTGSMEERGQLQVTSILRRVDHSSVLFFLGILIAVAGLETAGILPDVAIVLDRTFGNIFAVTTAIGLLSAIVDNVPLVAAAQAMYPMTTYPPDHQFWELLAYCAGTGGSILIIGSAAGVSVMGILGIEFGWYVRRMALPAALGYFGGILTFWLMWHA
ncbi:MAG: sodium:proton antiporter NhaD [Flavobacteriales bacterium]|nr:sodium:proton antiporter NhaD [Flavobacteriales bacterium]